MTGAPADAPPPPATPELDVADRDGLVLVRVRGALDIYSAAGFRERVEDLPGPGARIAVDLDEVTLLDSAGLGALVGLRNRTAEHASARFGIVCPHRRLRRVLGISGLGAELAIGRDLDDLRRAWGPAGDGGPPARSGGADGGAAPAQPERAAR